MLGLGSYLGDDTVLVTPSEAKSVYPMLNTDGIVGGMYSKTDGSIDPTGKICQLVTFFLRKLQTKIIFNKSAKKVCVSGSILETKAIFLLK